MSPKLVRIDKNERLPQPILTLPCTHYSGLTHREEASLSKPETQAAGHMCR